MTSAVPQKKTLSMSNEVNTRLELANRIAVEAGKITLKHFRKPTLDVIKKRDGSPVTVADQESETFLREQIAASFPDDAIVGEEYGSTEGTSGFTWILDPIDGTKSFISGVPLYGTMVAVEQAVADGDRKSLIGSVYLPGIDEGIFASEGNGAWYFTGDKSPVRAAVSKTTSLEDAVVATSAVETFGKRERDAMDVYHRLAAATWYSRTWGDVFGYLLVATGRVDIMIDPILNVWDAAAVQPIIQEAGGRFSDWVGVSRIDAGESIGSNGLLHQEVLKLIAQQ
jgi:histidinol phosphatase-like enzyme (inositol monophosphatase family)